MPAAPLRGVRIDDAQFAAWRRITARIVAAQGSRVILRDALAAMLELADAATDEQLADAMNRYYLKQEGSPDDA